MEFKEMNLEPQVLKAINDKGGYKQPTPPIQIQSIPSILKGKDLLGQAATGTGKTAAFAMPILTKLSKEKVSSDSYNKVKALILAPTRELAIQIGESFETYGRHMEVQVGVIYGGVTPKRHIKVMKREPSILVATPGRLLDLNERGCMDLSAVETLVLDEADRMLDLGMSKDVGRILGMLPKKRQNLMFSATMPGGAVTKLVNSILKNPVRVSVKHKPSKKGIHKTKGLLCG